MKRKDTAFLLLGLIMVAVGFFLLRRLPSGVSMPWPYLLLGLGCGAFSWGGGELLKKKALAQDPDLERRLRIQQEDERNRTISDRAKARTYDASLYLYGALMVCFVLMGVELSVILLLVGVYLALTGISVYYHWKYQREM